MEVSKQRKGAALVEFAVVLPTMVLVFFSIVEISRVLMLQHTADTTAYEGARAGIVPGATTEDIRTAAMQLIEAAELVEAEIEIEPDTITEATSVIAVSVSIPVAENSWIAPQLHKDLSVTSRVALYCERPPLATLTGVPQIKANRGQIKKLLKEVAQ